MTKGSDTKMPDDLGVALKLDIGGQLGAVRELAQLTPEALNAKLVDEVAVAVRAMVRVALIVFVRDLPERSREIFRDGDDLPGEVFKAVAKKMAWFNGGVRGRTDAVLENMRQVLSSFIER